MNISGIDKQPEVIAGYREDRPASAKHSIIRRRGSMIMTISRTIRLVAILTILFFGFHFELSSFSSGTLATGFSRIHSHSLNAKLKAFESIEISRLMVADFAPSSLPSPLYRKILFGDIENKFSLQKKDQDVLMMRYSFSVYCLTLWKHTL